MAEHYAPGAQKIFYQAKNRYTGVDILVEICLSACEEDSIIIPLVESMKFPGLYSFTYQFTVGTWLAAFYEDGAQTISQVYIIRSFKNGSNKGPQVL